MKTKRYIRPALHIVKISTLQMISSSPGVNRSLQNEEVDCAWTKQNNGSGSNGDIWDEGW